MSVYNYVKVSFLGFFSPLYQIPKYLNLLNVIPIPAAAKYCATGHPRPPAPTTSTEALHSFICPEEHSHNKKERK